MKENKENETLDYTDLQLLDTLQRDASLSNQTLAERLGLSATCLRRVRRLHALGLIERSVTVLQPERAASLLGHGLQALVEITLDRQVPRRWTPSRPWP
jgi:DNA-binding Lrp family transcriptional regulator